MRAGVLAWQLATIHHFCEHISEAARYLTPRMGWAYQYENMAQQILRVAKECLAGTPSHTR